ncbi:MAG: hypothetical protein R3D28_00085 [Geminicoccaceae bacterium]
MLLLDRRLGQELDAVELAFRLEARQGGKGGFGLAEALDQPAEEGGADAARPCQPEPSAALAAPVRWPALRFVRRGWGRRPWAPALR